MKAMLQREPLLLGQGIYDVDEIARLVRRRPHEVSAWADPHRSLLLPRDRGGFSFHNLVSAAVVAELRRRDVALNRIRDARHWLNGELNVPWPLAHAAGLRKLASVGRSVYYDSTDDGWLDVGLGGQLAFEDIVTPFIQHLEFDTTTNMASRWRPSEGVLLDTSIQAGAPCLDGTRLPTEFLAELAKAGDDVDDIAADYGVTVAVVRHALHYEHSLAA